MVVGKTFPAKAGNPGIPGKRSIAGTCPKVDGFHAVFSSFKSPTARNCIYNFLIFGIKSQIGGQNSYFMSKDSQAARKGPHFDGRAAPAQKWVVGLRYAQHAHRRGF